jgi:hypothetical protein
MAVIEQRGTSSSLGFDDLEEMELERLSADLDAATLRTAHTTAETMRELKESADRIKAIFAYSDNFKP